MRNEDIFTIFGVMITALVLLAIFTGAKAMSQKDVERDKEVESYEDCVLKEYGRTVQSYYLEMEENPEC